VVTIVPADSILAPRSPITQSDRTRFALLGSPLFLALIVTLANAIKPVVIDDTAYLTYTRHIAANPLDPYGFSIYWYTAPEPAFEVLAPPVVPYWLAVGVTLFGEHGALLKLWLLPFVWVFAWAVRDLLRRFARGTESRLLPLIVLSPAVLPTVNLMLDVPALGLGLAAVAVFARACEPVPALRHRASTQTDCGSWRLAVAAGVLAALAMQTKYTALLIPPAIGWYGVTHRRLRLAALAVLVSVTTFAAWEGALVANYGRSHFLHHAADQEPARADGEGHLAAYLRAKRDLAPPLAGHLGCVGIAVGLVAAAALGVARRWLVLAAGVWAAGLALIVFLPYRMTVLTAGEPGRTADVTATTAFWQAFGMLVLAALAGCAVLLSFRFGKGLRLRANGGTAFVVGWVLLELVGYFVLTPFPAARRVIGFVVVGGLLAGRALSRVERIHPQQRLPGWLIAFGIATGFAVAALDTLDAFPEKWCAERAAVIASDRPEGSTVWYAGHWGFQFYCERGGMKPAVPGHSVLQPGDILVLPVYPDEHRFYRPHIGSRPIRPPAWAAALLAEVVWDDAISGQTIPNFHGGSDPVVGRDHPRLRVVVYRIRAYWRVGSDH
jgi:hypothetical protein